MQVGHILKEKHWDRLEIGTIGWKRNRDGFEGQRRDLLLTQYTKEALVENHVLFS